MYWKNELGIKAVPIYKILCQNKASFGKGEITEPNKPTIHKTTKILTINQDWLSLFLLFAKKTKKPKSKARIAVINEEKAKEFTVD